MRVAFIGIDSSGKSSISRKVAREYEKEYGEKAGYLKLGSYSNSGKVARKAGKVFDAIGRIPSEKTAFESLKNTFYYLSFPVIKIMEEKGKDIMVNDRYPRLDLELFKEIHNNKKRTKVLYPLLKTLSGTAYPDIVVIPRRKPEEAMKDISKRKGVKDKHENIADLRKMDKALDSLIKDLENKGVKVIEIDVDKLIKRHGKGEVSSEKAAELVKKKVDELLEKEFK